MDIQILLNIFLILLCTKSFGLFTRKINLPQVVGALVAGVFLGPAIFKIIYPTETLNILSEMGVIMLMFAAGLETDLKQIKESFRASFIIATLGVIVPLILGYLLSYAFGFRTIESIFIGVLLTATSVSITVETLQELGKLKNKVGTAILGAAIIDDVIGIIILSVMMSMSSGLSVAMVGVTFIKIVVFFALAFTLGLAVYKLFEFIANKHDHTRRLPIFGLSFCFFMAYIAELAGIADITGAFVAGIVLCNTKSVHYIESKISILSYMLFSPIFFASIGLRTSFDGIDSTIILFTILLTLIAILSKVAGCGLGAKLCKFTNSESLKVGIGMISRGEVALIVADKGVKAGLLNPTFFPTVVIVVVVTTLITPILLKMSYANQVRRCDFEQ